MYCSNCGAKAAGKFCSECGHRLGTATESDPVVDWESSIDLAVVKHVPEVVDKIAMAEVRAEKRLQGNELLGLFDKVMTPLTGGLTVKTTAKITTPITSAMGFKTSKACSEFLVLPPGRVLANVLIAMAEFGHKLSKVDQKPDSCTLTAEIPADLCSVDGTLKITVNPSEGGTWLSLEAIVAGQWYDWGKCQRRIGEMLKAVNEAA